MNEANMIDGNTPRRLRCACGWETIGTQDEVIEAATQHGRDLHNMTPTRQQVLDMLDKP